MAVAHHTNKLGKSLHSPLGLFLGNSMAPLLLFYGYHAEQRNLNPTIGKVWMVTERIQKSEIFTRLFTKQLLSTIIAIFELPPSIMKSSDYFWMVLRRHRWKKVAGVSTQRIPKTNTTPSCYYRWPDRRVRREASLQENLSNYHFSDAVTGWRIDC